MVEFKLYSFVEAIASRSFEFPCNIDSSDSTNVSWAKTPSSSDAHVKRN